MDSLPSQCPPIHSSPNNHLPENSPACAPNSSNPPPQAAPASKVSTCQSRATPALPWSASRPSENRLSFPRSPRPSRKSPRTRSPRSQPSPVCSSMEALRSRSSICRVLLRALRRARVVVGRLFRRRRLVCLDLSNMIARILLAGQDLLTITRRVT